MSNTHRKWISIFKKFLGIIKFSFSNFEQNLPPNIRKLVTVCFKIFLLVYHILIDVFIHDQGFPCGSAGKECLPAVWETWVWALEFDLLLGRSPGEGKGYSLQYSGLENSMDCMVHWVENRWTCMSNFLMHEQYWGYSTLINNIYLSTPKVWKWLSCIIVKLLKGKGFDLWPN